MKISFEDYEATRSSLPLAPINTCAAPVNGSRRAGAGFTLTPPKNGPLFHAWRP